MRIVAVVPMKLNNHRLPEKNTMPFTNGKALCHYILATLLKVKGIEDIYVYCSNPNIRQFIPEEVKYLERPESLDGAAVKMNEVLQSFAKNVLADIYVLAHATAPFITVGSIENGLEAVVSGKYDSAFSVRKLQDFFWKDGKPLNYELADIPRTQDLEPIYEETSGFYIFRSEVIAKMNRRIGKKPFVVEVGEIESVDIDEAEDFEIADALFNYWLAKKRELHE